MYGLARAAWCDKAGWIGVGSQIELLYGDIKLVNDEFGEGRVGAGTTGVEGGVPFLPSMSSM